VCNVCVENHEVIEYYPTSVLITINALTSSIYISFNSGGLHESIAVTMKVTRWFVFSEISLLLVS
jgi:hypothetical protein